MIIRLLSVIIMIFAFCISAAAEQKLDNDKLYNIYQDKTWGRLKKLGDADFTEIRNVLIENSNISLTSTVEARRLYSFAAIFVREMWDRYGAKYDNYKTVLKDNEDITAFKSAERIVMISFNGGYYICSAGDEQEAKRLRVKANELKVKWSKKIHDDKEYKHTENHMKDVEAFFNVCKYSYIYRSLLSGYMNMANKFCYSRNANDKKCVEYRNKYNEYMIDTVIMDDQLVYDFMHDDSGAIAPEFILEYQNLLVEMNSLADPIVMTKDQAALVAESIMGKHRGVFDINAKFYISEDGYQNEQAVNRSATAISNLSYLLRKFGLDELNDRFLEYVIFENPDFGKQVIGCGVPKGYSEFLKEWVRKREGAVSNTTQ